MEQSEELTAKHEALKIEFSTMQDKYYNMLEENNKLQDRIRKLETANEYMTARQ